MGKITNFDITLNNIDGVCYSGSALQGYLSIELAGKVKLKDIRLRFHGYACVHWTERHSSGTGKNKRAVTKHYTADELYFDHTVVVFASKDDQDSLALGIHTFPFEFFVPKECPTSYEGTIGRVRYYVSARIHKLWSYDNFCLKPFTVINPFDLNQDSRSKSCAEAENEMMLCCLCCKSGPIGASLKLDKIGYAPGEIIPIQAEINNSSRRNISGATVTLQMVVKYTTPKKVKTHCNVIAVVTRGGIKAGKSEKWCNEKLTVPPVPPSFIEGCKIIDVSYVLELIVHPTGPAFNLPIKIEIIVGTVPLHHNFSLPLTPTETFIKTLQFSHFQKDSKSVGNGCQTVSPSTASGHNSVSTSHRNGTVQSSNSNILSPNSSRKAVMTFEESTLGKVQIDDEEESDKISGKIIFTPMYPYYRTSSSAGENFRIKDVPNRRKNNAENDKEASSSNKR